MVVVTVTLIHRFTQQICFEHEKYHKYSVTKDSVGNKKRLISLPSWYLHSGGRSKKEMQIVTDMY